MLNLFLTLLIVTFFIAVNCVTLYATFFFTIRTWHCYKIKIDPIAAVRPKNLSVAKADELKSNSEKILEMG